MIANNNIRSVILEIKYDRCKIVKILIFHSLFQERERNISILTILHLSYLISNMTLLILLFANITFTDQIEKEVKRIGKNAEEITKSISYILQFIDSARFMTSSLSCLVNNLSEGIHRIKC